MGDLFDSPPPLRPPSGPDPTGCDEGIAESAGLSAQLAALGTGRVIAIAAALVLLFAVVAAKSYDSASGDRWHVITATGGADRRISGTSAVVAEWI